MVLAGAALAEGFTPKLVPISVPSGQDIRWQETVSDAQGSAGRTIRFRFVAPAIADATKVDAEVALDDMLALCDTFAVPRIPNVGPQPEQIVISLADRDIPFGEANPDAVQYFEAYSIVDGHCQWEFF
ncbi:hypothetical protein BFP70_07780 [Thioclava sp. SK-1]|nr:hypothetical protein BFP70_07780 [Thioclava sp. SK-1]